MYKRQVYFNAFSVDDGLPTGDLIPPAQPDGSNVYSEEEQRELDCVEEHRATGNID